MPFVITCSMPGYLPEADPVIVGALAEAVAYVRDEIDRAVDQSIDGGADDDERAEWESALAHAESYRDGSGDLPAVPMPDGYVWRVEPLQRPSYPVVAYALPTDREDGRWLTTRDEALAVEENGDELVWIPATAGTPGS